MPPHIDIHLTTEGMTSLVHVKGDIDLNTSTTFSGHVLPIAYRADRLALDLTSVGFIDSSGLSAVVRVRRALQERGLALHIVPSRRVRAALELASLTGAVTMHESIESAMRVDGSTAEPA